MIAAVTASYDARGLKMVRGAATERCRDQYSFRLTKIRLIRSQRDSVGGIIVKQMKTRYKYPVVHFYSGTPLALRISACSLCVTKDKFFAGIRSLEIWIAAWSKRSMRMPLFEK